MFEVMRVSDLEVNPNLGRDLEVAVLVKWTNQSYHDENLRSMFTGDWDERADVSKSNAGRHRQRYYDGLVACFDLATDYLDSSNAVSAQHEVQPTDIDINESSIILAAGNRLLLRKSINGKNEADIRNPWFARLHSVDRISEDKILTVSSSFDEIFIVDTAGNEVQSFDIWKSNRNINKFGHLILKEAADFTGPLRRNPNIDELKVDNNVPSRINLIDDPLIYKGLGLPTYLTPVFVNHVANDKQNNRILATTLNTGECWTIHPETGEISVVGRDLSKPHGLRVFQDGYIVTDSGREEILILNNGYKTIRSYSTASFADRKAGLEKSFWLQNTTEISDGILATISAPRQKVTLIDTNNQEYRDIPFDPEWGIQVIKAYGNTHKT